MKFSCEKSILQTAVNTAANAAASKSSIPVLEGVLIEVTDKVKITGYDLKTGISVTFDADIEQQGAIVLEKKIFADIVRSFPDEIVFIEQVKNTVTIWCNKTKYSISGMEADDFPELPIVEEENAITIKQNVLMSMIRQTIFSVGKDESRPIYTGELFDIDETGVLTMVAVDGFRIALRKEKLDEAKSGSFVVPYQALQEAANICKDSEEFAQIMVGKNHIMFKFGNTVLISRRLEGSFLNYKRTVPYDQPIVVTTDKRQILTAIDRCSRIITEQQKSPVKITLSGNVMNFEATTALGTAHDVCLVESTGEDLRIGFNTRYLSEALKFIPNEKVRMTFKTPITSCTILPMADEEQNFAYMVLPVRL